MIKYNLFNDNAYIVDKQIKKAKKLNAINIYLMIILLLMLVASFIY